MRKIVVHTIEARSNVMLDVIRDFFGLTSGQMLLQIQTMLSRTVVVLASKGIAYAELKAALTPQQDRREAAFVFDTSEMGESWHGLPIHERLLPHLHKSSSRSILVGDYIGHGGDQGLLHEMLTEDLVLKRNVNWRHSSQFYIIYINNLTDTMLNNLDRGFDGFDPYVGFVDTTYASPFKAYLSTILVKHCIQHRNIVICPHEEDRPDSDDVNLSGYPFEKFGFTIRSVASSTFGVLLSYNIERPVVTRLETDTEFSLNAVHANPLPLDDFEIEIDVKKFDYLNREKSEALRKLGFLGGDLGEFKSMIRAKIASNYIYSMTHDDQHDTTQFNIIIEVRKPDTNPFRVLIGLEYFPGEKKLRLITMF